MTLVVATACLYGALIVWAVLADEPVLLAREAGRDRAELYRLLAGTAVTLLGVSLTVLAILVALPDRPAVRDLRRGATWPRLQSTLLATAGLCLVTAIAGHVGAAVDAASSGQEWLSLLVLATATASVGALTTSGIVFGLFLRAAEQPPDPSAGRGAGPV